MNVSEFASKIRAKYPGAYDQVDDGTLSDKIVAKYPQYAAQIDQTPTGQPEPQAVDNPAAGAEVPVEQKLANNAVETGNGMGMGFGIPAMAEGLAGLGMKAAGAIGKGMGEAADTVGSWIPNGWKNLDPNALKAKQDVIDATHWAMNPHPEVQQAIMDITHGNPSSAIPAAEDAEGTGETTIKQINPKPETGLDTVNYKPFDPELPMGGEKLGPGATRINSGAKQLPGTKALADIQNPEVVDEGGTSKPSSNQSTDDEPVDTEGYSDTVKAVPQDEEAPSEMGLFDKPIFSMDNLTPTKQLQHTEDQMGVVGKAIGDQLNKLTDSGKLYDPAQTAKQLESMYIKDYSGRVIPPGDSSEQAVNNAAVNHALNTLKVEGMDDDGILHELPWERANGIKGALQRLANDTEDPVTTQAARMIRDSIDDQGQKVLAENGDDIAPFQQLRDAYGNLAKVHGTLNAQVRSGLGMKNQIPVVRGGAALAGAFTGNPGVAAAAGTDFFGRKYGTLAVARGLQKAGEMGDSMAGAGGSMATATKPAAKGIAAGLLNGEEDD